MPHRPAVCSGNRNERSFANCAGNAGFAKFQEQTKRADDRNPCGRKIFRRESKDFIGIQAELEKISMSVESLQLWAEQMLATGAIDVVQYNAHKNKE